MSNTKYDERNLIDGPADIIIKDPAAAPLSVATSGSVTCTDSVLTMAYSPITAGFRVGDVVKVGAAGTEARRISELSATQITLETALSAPPTFDAYITRVGVNAGYSREGASVRTRTTYQDREADQALDPISTKPESRQTLIRTTLQEMEATQAQLALGLPESSIETVADGFRIKVGVTTLTLNTFGVMLLGSREDGKKVTVYASRVVNQGESGFEFGRGGASGLALELKVLNDSGRDAGEEAFSVDVRDVYDLDYLCD